MSKLSCIPSVLLSTVLAVAVLSPQDVQSAKILFFHNLASYSHRVPTYALAEALVARGHEVTYISPYYPRGNVNPKIKEIVPKKYAQIMSDTLDKDLDINISIKKQLLPLVYSFYDLVTLTCEELLKSQELKDYFESTTSLDLVIMDNCMSECAFGIVHKYKAKFIYFSTVIHIPNEFDVLGIAPESSAIPEMEMEPYTFPMSLWKRTVNALISIHFRYEHYKYMSRLDGMLRQYLNVSDMPFVDDLARNASLMFYTGDVVTDYSRAHPPQIVNIAGIHCKTESKPLPQEIDWFVNNGTDGFVYISLGSLADSSIMPEYLKQIFYNTIESFPKLRFLWKWNGEFPKKIPSNLYLAKWFPQADVLAHPKIKGFVMQGGRPSLFESLWQAVPMITMPILGDQQANSNRLSMVGASILLDLSTITKEKFVNAMHEMVYEPRMKQRMLRLRDIVLDQPMTPLERGVWWTEYVLRQPDTEHLKSSSHSQYWFQRRMIDVWFVVFSVLLISVLILGKICLVIKKVTFNILGSSNVNKQKAN